MFDFKYAKGNQLQFQMEHPPIFEIRAHSSHLPAAHWLLGRSISSLVEMKGHQHPFDTSRL